MNIKKCPKCKRKNTLPSRQYLTREDETEILVPAYCPECGYSWYIVYIPERTEER